MSSIASSGPCVTFSGDISRTGITELYSPSDPIVDICFVHGFTGHPERTWASKKRATSSHQALRQHPQPTKRQRFGRLLPSLNAGNEVNDVHDAAVDAPKHVYWPRDLVPDIAPGARVLTFGYDTDIRHSFQGPVSQNKLSDHANDFLASLEYCRRQNPRRPLIFIAHSLGGLLVKDALRISKSYEYTQPDRWLVYGSTTSLFFFGTPHAGADPRTTFHRVLTNTIKAFGFRVNEDIVRTLMPGAERSKLLAEDFSRSISERDWTIYTFQEEWAHAKLGVKIVEDQSSCINDPRHERIVHIRADHVDMCRFTGASDPEFRKVSSALLNATERLPAPQSPADDVDRLQASDSLENICVLSSDQVDDILERLSFEGIEARYMVLKNAQRKTCQWLPKHKIYKAWLDPSQVGIHHGFLWIKGKPGTGKSVSMKYLYQHVMRHRKNHIVIKYFFNARGDTLEHSTEGMYRSLLFQLLKELSPTRIDSEALRQLLSLGRNASWPLEILKEALRAVMGEIQSHDLYCFVDALDECSEDEVRDMIMFFEEIGEDSVGCPSKFRVCFSSRHYPYITIRRGLQLVLEDEDDHSNDIRDFIHSQLRIDRAEGGQGIEDEIFDGSSKIFLWAALVVDILNKEYDKGGNVTVRERLRQMPRGLHELFQDILTRDSENIGELILCVKWILFAKRPLRPEEFYVAMQLGIDPVASPFWDETVVPVQRIYRYNLNVSKGLAEITKKSPRVQFIHESVRDYLLRDRGLDTLLLQARNVRHNFSEATSHDTLRDICMAQISSPTLCKDLIIDGQLDARLPFLRYAVTFVLSHADSGQQLGSNQTAFLEVFPTADWVSLDNKLQRYKSRHHLEEVPLLYLLAEQNLPNLIRVHPERKLALDMECRTERYGRPIVAAIAFGNNEAISALALSIAEGCLPPDQLQKLDRIQRELIEMPRFKADIDNNWKQKSLLSVICALGSISLVEALWVPRLAAMSLDPKLRFVNIQGPTTINAYKYIARKRAIDGQLQGDVDLQPLLMAVKQDDAPTVEILLSEGALATVSQTSKNRYLEFSKSGTVAGLLLQYGVTIDDWLRCKTQSIFTAGIASALKSMSREEKRAFIRSEDKHGSTLAHALSTNGVNSLGLLHSILLIDDTITNLKDRLGHTPLQIATLNASDEAVWILYHVGHAEIDYSDKDTLQLLLYGSCVNGSYDTVQHLLNMGADPNLESQSGSRPLDLAVRRSRVLELLLQCPSIEVNYNNANGDTLVTKALYFGTIECFELILNHPTIDVNRPMTHGDTPLAIAIRLILPGPRLQFARLLLGHPSIKLNSTSPEPLLHIAAKNSSLEVAKLLLQYHSVDVNIRVAKGLSPLLVAAWYADSDFINLLWNDPRVDRTAQCENGWGVMDYATNNTRHPDVAKRAKSGTLFS